MVPSPNSALLLGVGCSAEAQRARIAAAVQALEEKKAAALAAERYEDCATLRDALVPLRAQRPYSMSIQSKTCLCRGHAILALRIASLIS